MSKLDDNLKLIKTQVAHYNPTIIAVTKYFDESKIVEYYNSGLRDFGENRIQDALSKMEKLPKEILENSRFHLIGHLQTNKVKNAVGNFYLIHSVDSVKLAKAISEEAQKKGIVQKILLQINNACEEQKFGFCVDELRKSFKEMIGLPSIEILGLMNIAPLEISDDELHKLFSQIKRLKDDLVSEYGLELNEISMGMSNDYGIALEEGATIIRLGRILFK